MAQRSKRAASQKIRKVMREYKRGTLHSGRARKPVKSRKQAVAIALSEARKSGANIPQKGGRRARR